MVRQYAQWIVKWRYLVVIGTIALFALGIFLTVKGPITDGDFLPFKNDYRVFFKDSNPQLEAFDEIQETYIKNDNVLFMIEPDDGTVFTPKNLEIIAEMTEMSWQVPLSTRVDSITNFQHTYAEGDDLTVEDLVSNFADLTEADLQRIQEITNDEPLLLNRLISPTGDVAGVNITVQLPEPDSGEFSQASASIVEASRQIAKDIEAKYPNVTVYQTGMVMMNAAFDEAAKSDGQTLLPLAFLAILVGLVVLFWAMNKMLVASVWSMFTTLIIIILSVLGAMFTAGWLGMPITTPTTAAPVMILTIAVADCVHVLATYLQQLRKGVHRFDAMAESLRVNVQPIFLTSLTTALGFLSLNFSDSPPFNDLGNMTAIGVSFAFLLSVTFLPALAVIPRLPVRVAEKDKKTIMQNFAEFVIAKRTTLLWSSSALIILFAALVPMNQLNDQFVEYFDEDIDFRTHTDYIAEKLTGIYLVEYSLGGDEADLVNDPAFMAKVEKFSDWFKQQPELLHINTYTPTMKRLNQNMNGGDKEQYFLPTQKDLAAQYLLLYEMSLPYGLDLNNQLSIDKSAARMIVTYKTLTSKQVLDVEQRADNWLAENLPELRTPGASPTVMFAHIGQRNIKSMLLGTTVALLLISFVLIFALRSLRYGLISLLPNLLPAAVSFGAWGLFVGQVGLALSVVAGMTLGIVVDDTVHFLSKYIRAKREQNLSTQDAVRYAFSNVGMALVITSLVLFGGFMVLSLSSFELNSGMGLLTAITIAFALLIDFLFLPPFLMKLEEYTDEKAKRSSAGNVVHQPAV